MTVTVGLSVARETNNQSVFTEPISPLYRLLLWGYEGT